jgi:hypothetical protein
MPEKPQDADEYERDRRESTDLGYRDTEEEEAYEHAEEAAAQGETPEEDEPPVGGG